MHVYNKCMFSNRKRKSNRRIRWREGGIEEEKGRKGGERGKMRGKERMGRNLDGIQREAHADTTDLTGYAALRGCYMYGIRYGPVPEMDDL